MKELKMKAKAGFTLVELLVVMLILVILSVSLLPMFKESICRAQYSADAIPVIATIRTRIGLYQYEHNKLPGNPVQKDVTEWNGDMGVVSSWEFVRDNQEQYIPATYTFGASPGKPNVTSDKLTDTKKDRLYEKKDASDLDLTNWKGPLHLGFNSMLDIDYQDLRGRHSRPIDYVYYKIPCEKNTDSAYLIGCFGSGYGGLAAGTGYAVCEINLVSEGKKYIGVFERYKAKEKSKDEECPYLYLSDDQNALDGDVVYCPKYIDAGMLTEQADKRPQIVWTMEQKGWKFAD